MANESVLVVEDEPEILELVEYNLRKNGYDTVGATSGEQALRLAHSSPPDLIVLDLMLPGMDGLEVCRTLKSDPATCRIPIVILTARGEEADIVAGLEVGADDYVTKPFSPRVLVARVRAVLRRRAREEQDEHATISLHGITIIPGRHEVLVKGKAVELTRTEFLILHLLMRRPGWVFTRQQIIEAARGHTSVTDRAVDVHIVSLRRKLGPAGERVETVRGVGYRFRE
jgi:two-component system alkaline phosphatase synthesis response regulator PhoP